MKTIYTFLILFLGVSLNAQDIEQVSVSPAYGQQAYYTLSTGEVQVVDNDAWDLAFSNDGLQDAGVFINESAPLEGAGLQVHLAPTANFDDIITDTDQFTEETQMHNPEIDWTNGVFNSTRSLMDPFDYGWGRYSPMLNTVVGNQVYVIRLRDESWIKFMIEKLEITDYHIKWADLDGANEQTAIISKSAEADVLMHFSFASSDVVDMPRDYDLIFQRYTTPAFFPQQSPDTLEYMVTGVLLGPGTRAVVARDVNPDDVNEADYSDQYTDQVNTIGYDWKEFDFTIGWIMDLERAQFVKTSDDRVYKIVFLDFEGASTGTTTLEKTDLGIVATDDLWKWGISIYPNPASDRYEIETPELQELQIEWYSTDGRLQSHNNILSNTAQTIPLDLTSGQYYLRVMDGEKSAILPVRIQR